MFCPSCEGEYSYVFKTDINTSEVLCETPLAPCFFGYSEADTVGDFFFKICEIKFTALNVSSFRASRFNVFIISSH